MKDCKIKDAIYYQSWKNDYWKAGIGVTCSDGGDEDAIITADVEFDHGERDEYFDNNAKLADFAVANYIAGHVYPVY